MEKECNKKWIELNPTFNMLWYSNKNCDYFMLKNYSGPINDAYKILKPGAYKADLWRLCILYKYGGIYIDAYATPFVSLKKMLPKYSFVSILDASIYGKGIHNGFIMAKRHHPFLKQCIEDIVENVNNKFYGKSSLDITGPIALSKAINKVLKKPYNKHVKGINNHGKLSYYLYDFHWGIYQNIYDKDTKIFKKYYSFLYYLYRKNIKNDGYHIMWKQKKVY
jgi:mannosyltransferase OCH1-like enzyme